MKNFFTRSRFVVLIILASLFFQTNLISSLYLDDENCDVYCDNYKYFDFYFYEYPQVKFTQKHDYQLSNKYYNFDFKFVFAKDSFQHLSMVNITNANNQFINTIYVPRTFYDNDSKLKLDYMIGDFNFDGYQDIRIPRSFELMENDDSFYYYFYNPQSNKFEFQIELENIYKFKIDYTKKQIKSLDYELNFDEESPKYSINIHSNNTYKFINNKLTLISIDEEQEYIFYSFLNIFNNNSNDILELYDYKFLKERFTDYLGYKSIDFPNSIPGVFIDENQENLYSASEYKYRRVGQLINNKWVYTINYIKTT